MTRVPVFIKVMDINDNAPEFAMFYETFVCENAKAGQVMVIMICSPPAILLNVFSMWAP